MCEYRTFCHITSGIVRNSAHSPSYTVSTHTNYVTHTLSTTAKIGTPIHIPEKYKYKVQKPPKRHQRGRFYQHTSGGASL